jgi:hypothetical protein
LDGNVRDATSGRRVGSGFLTRVGGFQADRVGVVPEQSLLPVVEVQLHVDATRFEGDGDEVGHGARHLARDRDAPLDLLDVLPDDLGRSTATVGAIWTCSPPQSRATSRDRRPSNSPDRATTDVPSANQAMVTET